MIRSAGDVPLGTQPMSVNNEKVRSLGCVTSWVRSKFIFGSINWFGKALVFQCETEEPPTKGLGAYIRARPRLSDPAGTAGSTPRVPFTPDPSWDLIVLPSASVIRTAGIVIVGSNPPRPAGGLPATLSTMTTPIAPAACAFFAFAVNAQVPRSMSAIFPAIAAALVKVVQPSVV